jgi:hypothetical protein
LAAENSDWLRGLEQRLAEIQTRTALMFYCRPLNFDAERARLLSAWEVGRGGEPEFVYPAPPNLSTERRELEALARAAERFGEIGKLYAERALELELEAELAEASGQGHFLSLSARRFAPSLVAEPHLEGLLDSWSEPYPVLGETLIASDNLAHANSLIRQLERLSQEAGLAFRCVRVPGLVSAAATGDNSFVVAVGRELGASAARRIAVHEVYGHGVPTQNARRQRLGLFRLGSAAGLDTQEGYALWCEQHAGLLDPARKLELMLRHRAAAACLRGVSFSEVCFDLLQRGAALEMGLSVTLRVFRGGGLAREVTYVPAFVRVDAALSADPELGRWLNVGRLSLHAIAVLRRQGVVLVG